MTPAWVIHHLILNYGYLASLSALQSQGRQVTIKVSAKLNDRQIRDTQITFSI